MQSTAMHTEAHTWPSSQTGIQRLLPHRASLRSSRMYSSQASGSWVQADFRRQPRRANMPHGVSAKKKAWSASEKRWPARGFRALTEMLPNTALKWHRFWQQSLFCKICCQFRDVFGTIFGNTQRIEKYRAVFNM